MKSKEEMLTKLMQVQRRGRAIALVALPTIAILALMNMYLQTFLHRETLGIMFLNEKINKKETDYSSNDFPELYTKFRGSENSKELRKFGDTVKESNKNSGKDDQVSPDDKGVKSVKDALVSTRDESIDEMVMKLGKMHLFFPSYFWNSSIRDLTRRLGVIARKPPKALPGVAYIKPSSGKMPAWKLFHRNIRRFSLYDPDDPNMNTMLRDMATLPIAEAEEKLTNMKKVQRIVRNLVLVALPMVLLLPLINMYFLNFRHRESSKRMIIFNKGDQNKESGYSSKDLQGLPSEYIGDDDSTELGQFDDIEKEPNKMFGQDDQVPQELMDINSVKDALVVMKDEAIDRMVEKLGKVHLFFPSYFWESNLSDLTRRLGATGRKHAKTLPGYAYYKLPSGKKPAWKLFNRNVRQFSLYDPDDPNLNKVLIDMATLPMVEAEQNEKGSQLNVIVTFSDEGRAIMKFMRYPREVETEEDRFFFDDPERHVAEIAAFQLDKLLGFYRVPPTIGRRVNITSELVPIIPPSMSYTLFKSPVGNWCFYGDCDSFCDSGHAFCGHPDMIEVSVQSYLPSRSVAQRKSWYQPWRRSHSTRHKAYWEKNDDLCDIIRNKAPYNNGKLLLDIIDAHTFDFLTGNQDRHSFVTFDNFGNYSFPILYDNGKGFGRQTYDDLSILAPLRQCCLIRKSTLLKYVKLYVGTERLSDVMEKALETDPIAPVLIKPHLNALDRRLLKILQVVAECLEDRTVNEVVKQGIF